MKRAERGKEVSRGMRVKPKARGRREGEGPKELGERDKARERKATGKVVEKGKKPKREKGEIRRTFLETRLAGQKIALWFSTVSGPRIQSSTFPRARE